MLRREARAGLPFDAGAALFADVGLAGGLEDEGLVVGEEAADDGGAGADFVQVRAMEGDEAVGADDDVEGVRVGLDLDGVADAEVLAVAVRDGRAAAHADVDVCVGLLDDLADVAGQVAVRADEVTGRMGSSPPRAQSLDE